MTELVKLEHRDKALIIWNNNPKQRNPLSPEYCQGLLKGYEQAANDQKVAAVILAGEGDFFSSGGNLNSLKEHSKLSMDGRREEIEKLNNIIRAARSCPKPVIAAVEGGAAGAGVSLAMNCDMIVASQSAKFTLAYVKAGLVPDGGATYALAQALPRATTMPMALMGQPLSAARMYQLGAVTEVTAPGEAVTRAVDLANELFRGPNDSISSIKALVNEAETASFEEQLSNEREAMAIAMGDEEAKIGVSAFLSKKVPIFR